MLNRCNRLLIEGHLVEQRWELLYSFSGTIILFFSTRRILSAAMINLSQTVFWNFRRGIIKTILGSEFKLIDTSKNDIYSTLTSDAHHITGASLLVIELVSSSILAITCIIYMAFISFPLFLVSLFTILVGVVIYQYGTKESNALFKHTRNLEQQFLTYFNAILGGTKEINLEPEKGIDIYTKKINQICDHAFHSNTKAYTRYLNNQIIGQLLFYMLITTIILFSGSYFKTEGAVTISSVFILLYLLTPIENILVILPAIHTGIIALNKVLTLKAHLEKGTPSSLNEPGTEKAYLNFECLTAYQLEYKYTDSPSSFCIGPIHFELHRGEIVFIYGGNGSGKTTFLYSLLGLYTPTKGSLSVGNTWIHISNLHAYKSLFSVIFSDFYLFDELYGLSNPNPEKLAYYLTLFEIENKVTILDGKFSTIGLSTGQRKRLALIAVLMEAKPILVLDEWAADQDPAFRKKFYTQIIPLLITEGFTIIAITHDDMFYPCADRLYRMEYGKLIEEQIRAELTLNQIPQVFPFV